MKKAIQKAEPLVNVGDYVRTRPFLNKAIFGTISKIEPLEDGVSFKYEISSIDGATYSCYAPELITKMIAKELIRDAKRSIEFLNKI